MREHDAGCVYRDTNDAALDKQHVCCPCWCHEDDMKDPTEIIDDWCDFHLSDSTSRWPSDGWMHEGVEPAANGLIYAGDGIVNALRKEGYVIVRAEA